MTFDARTHLLVQHGPVPPPRVVPADELRRYAGEYQSEIGVIKVAVEGEHLTLHAGGDPSPAPLVPGDQPGTFQVHGPGQVRLKFHDDGKGPSRTVELSVRGKVVVGTRGK